MQLSERYKSIREADLSKTPRCSLVKVKEELELALTYQHHFSFALQGEMRELLLNINRHLFKLPKK